MLILKRRVGETLMVGDNVALTVLGIRGRQIRIGIDAPKSVAVQRKEAFMLCRSEKTIVQRAEACAQVRKGAA